MPKYRFTFKVSFFPSASATADDATDAQYLAEQKLKRMLSKYAEEMDTIWGEIDDWDIEVYDADESPQLAFSNDTMQQLEELCDITRK